MGAPNLASTLIPESLDNSLSYSIVNYLKRLKNQAKAEFDRVCTEVGRTRPASIEAIKVNPRSSFRRDFISNPNLIGNIIFFSPCDGSESVGISCGPGRLAEVDQRCFGGGRGKTL